ncbi:MAG: anti-sigma factor [Caulobacteraceae bacterium]
MSDRPLPFDGDDGADMMAAEYALGVLDQLGRARAERRMTEDPHFNAEVHAWEERLAPLADEITPVPAPAGVWPRIAAALAGPASQEAKRWERQTLWRNLGFWRGATAASLALAAASLVLVLLPPKQPTRAPITLAASLAPPDAPEPYIVTVDAKTGVVTAPGQPAPDPTRSAELWLIPEGEKPRSLGVLDPSRPHEVKLSPELARRAVEGAVIAVTLEPLGGSPTGDPTGPVIAKGTLASL